MPIVLLFLSACQTRPASSVFEIVANRITEGDYENYAGYQGIWFRTGVHSATAGYVDQATGNSEPSQQCVQWLEIKYRLGDERKHHPDETLATALLLQCMQSKGWTFEVHDTVIVH